MANVDSIWVANVIDKRIDKIYKINRKSNSMESLVFTFSDGSLEFVDSMENNFKPGCNFNFGSKPVSQGWSSQFYFNNFQIKKIIKIFVKNPKFFAKNQIFRQKSKFSPKNQTFRQK